MSHTPHELRDEFPDAHEILHDLKTHNAHFAALADRYHDLNREVHRIEAEVEAASDARAEDLKKERLKLLDEIAQMVSAAKAA
ncbi:MAG: YdcH family protein [Chakrabartia sp.]